MSVSLILTSGFLFLGGIVLGAVRPDGPMHWLGGLFLVMGAFPLLCCWVREFWNTVLVRLVTGYTPDDPDFKQDQP